MTGGYYSDYFHSNKRGKSTCGNKTVLIHARMPRLELARMKVSPTAHEILDVKMTGQRQTLSKQLKVYIWTFFFKSVKLIRIEICAPVSSRGMLF